MNHQILLKLKDLYNNNINITNYLRNELNQAANNSDIIEIAYDLQSGTYIKNAEQNSEKLIEIQNEYYNLIQPHISEGDSILDIGTGELTTLTGLVNLIELNNIEIYAKVNVTANTPNIAGGIVCESPGVIPINKELLLSEAIKLL